MYRMSRRSRIRAVFDSRAIDALESLLQAARDAGYTPYINTAYRPYSAQEYIFNGKASQIAWSGQVTYEEAVEQAKSIVAYPGTSEHQTGLACDITDQYYSTMDASKMDQGLLTWLKDHCAEYGFILRYPANKESITGWNEPWHFRYVGVEAAKFMTENDLCLEEFWNLYK
jgi:D-alanyl-D-alanine carboxypeptidase